MCPLPTFTNRNEPVQLNESTPQQGELLGSGDEEDVQFLQALKGLVDGAVKLLGADKGMGAWLMSGLLRKSGVIDVRWRVAHGRCVALLTCTRLLVLVRCREPRISFCYSTCLLTRSRY